MGLGVIAKVVLGLQTAAMSVPPFVRQQALTVNRAVRPEDSVSNISSSSWTHLPDPPEAFSWTGPIESTEEDDDLPPADLKLPKVIDLDNKVKPSQDASKSSDPLPQDQAQTPADQPAEQGTEPRPAPAAKARPTMAAQSLAAPSMAAPAPQAAASTAAPATQAAQNFLAGTNPQYGSRKVRKQAERAARKGARSLRLGQMGVHNALSATLPPYLRQVGAGTEERLVWTLVTKGSHPRSRTASLMRYWSTHRLESMCFLTLVRCEVPALGTT